MKRYFYIGFLALVLVTGGTAHAESTDLNAIHRLAEQGERKAALQKLDKYIAADGNDIQSRFLKGLLLLEEGDTTAAQEVFAELARRFPWLAEAHNNLAVIYASEGKYERAQQALLDAAGSDPDHATLQANLGDLYIKMAATAYRKTLELNPDDQATQAKLKLIEQLLVADN